MKTHGFVYQHGFNYNPNSEKKFNIKGINLGKFICASVASPAIWIKSMRAHKDEEMRNIPHVGKIYITSNHNNSSQTASHTLEVENLYAELLQKKGKFRIHWNCLIHQIHHVSCTSEARRLSSEHLQTSTKFQHQNPWTMNEKLWKFFFSFILLYFTFFFIVLLMS